MGCSLTLVTMEAAASKSVGHACSLRHCSCHAEPRVTAIGSRKESPASLGDYLRKPDRKSSSTGDHCMKAASQVTNTCVPSVSVHLADICGGRSLSSLLRPTLLKLLKHQAECDDGGWQELLRLRLITLVALLKAAPSETGRWASCWTRWRLIRRCRERKPRKSWRPPCTPAAPTAGQLGPAGSLQSPA